MKKYSLFGFLTYLLDFSYFFILCVALGLITKEEMIIVFVVYFIGNIYLTSGMRRARRSDLNFQTVVKSTLAPAKFMTGRFVLCNLIPLLLAFVFDLTILGGAFVCAIVGFILLGKNLSTRMLDIFFRNVDAYKMQIEEKQIILVIDHKKVDAFIINVDDIIEFAHIAGDYYLLKNIIRKDQQNDDIEENNEDKLLEA